MTAPRLSVDNVSVAYSGGAPVVKNVTLTLEEGEIGCLLGRSGCGKTCLLRAIAGFEPVVAGRILLNGVVISDPAGRLPPERRNIGMMFQDFALFPHLPVHDNIAFGLRRFGTREASRRVTELLALMNLSHAAQTYPHELSGGQQQRVALARAMAPRPDILLMDEPFSAIDPDLREQLAGEIRSQLRRDKVTAILVTHDQSKAFAMADWIAVFGEGQLKQCGSAHDLYHRPANRYVADFIGQGRLIPGVLADGQKIATGLGLVEGAVPDTGKTDSAVDVLVRPDDILHDDDSPLRLTIIAKAFRGAEFLYTLKISERTQALWATPSRHDYPVGAAIGVRLRPGRFTVFPSRAR